MKLDEYLIRNGVKLFINPLTPKVNRVRQITSVPMITPKTSTMSSASMSGFATIASITMQS